MGEESVDRVGLGVDLLNGQETLNMVRAIREEMQTIARLGGGGSGSGLSGGSSRANAITGRPLADEKAEADQFIRIRKDRANATRAISEEEVRAATAARQRRLELNQRINEREVRQAKEHAAELARIEEEYVRNTGKVRNRELGPTISQRSEPVDPKTRAFFEEQNRRAREVQRPIGTAGTPTAIISRATRDSEEYKKAAEESQRLLKDERQALLNDAVEREKANRERTRYVRSQLGPPNGGAGGRGGQLPPRPPGSGGPNGAFNERGFFTSGDAIGRITRNILLYEVISRATYGLTNYVTEAVEAAKVSVDFGNAQKFAAEQAGANVGVVQRLGDSLGQYGLTRQQGRTATTEAARLAKDHPEQIGSIVQTVTDIAASRGQGIQEVAKLIDEIRQGRPRLVEEYLQKNPDQIFQDYASQQLASRTTNRADNSGLYIGNKDPIKSRTQEIKDYVAGMDEAEKRTATLNYILSQAGNYSGQAADRANTLAGRLDKLNAVFADGKEDVGLFISEIKPLSDLLDALAGKAGLVSAFRPPQIGRSGPNGQITEADIAAFGNQSAYSTRARALSSVNDNLVPGLEGLAGLAIPALLGRGKANESAKLVAYYKTLGEATTRFGGDLSAAAIEANNLAKSTKAGLVRSVSAGFQRITVGLTQSIGDTFIGQGSALSRVGQGRYRGAIPAGVSLEDYRKLEQGSITTTQAGGGVAGGLIGGAAGAVLGNIIAQKLDVGPIVATGLTIAGGIAGTAAGTAAGDFLGRKLADSAGASAISVGGSIAGAALVTLAVAAYVATNEYSAFANRALQGIEGGEKARNVQQNEETKARTEGRLRYERITATGIESLTPEEYQARRDKDIRGIDRTTQLTSPGVGPAGLLGRLAQFFINPSPIGTALGFSNPEPDATATTRTFEDYRYQKRTLNRIPIAQDDEGSRAIISNSLNRVGASGVQNITEQIKDAQATINRLSSTPELQLVNKIEIDAETKKLYELSAALTTINDQTSADEKRHTYGTTDDKYIKDVIEPYRQGAAQRELERKQKEEKARQDLLSEQSNALARLRDVQQGSFRIVGDVGTSLAGESNPYTKVLADQITLATRMQQQWGSLGKAAVDYFTKVENVAINRQLNKLEYGTYQTASGLRGQADREASQRNAVGLSRSEQDYLAIQTEIVNKATQIPELWKEAAQVLRLPSLSPRAELAGRLNLINEAFGVRGARIRNVYGQDVTPDGTRRNVFGQSLGSTFGIDRPRQNLLGQSLEDPDTLNSFASLGAGKSPEVRAALQKSFAETILETFKGFTPAQIRGSGYQDLFVGAVRSQGQTLNYNIDQARRKAETGAEEDARLNKQLRADEDFRQQRIRQGANPKDVGRESDALLLSRTEGVNPKDLSYQQFSDRQAALRRTAERAEQDRAEAKAAVDQGLAQQGAILTEVAAIRAGIVGGNMSMLIQVQNDTQARIDQDNLKNLAQPGQNPSLDQGGLKSNPYTDSLTRYKRGGRKR